MSQDLYSWALGSAYRQYRLNDPSGLARDPMIDEKMDRDPKFAAASRYRRHLIAGRAWTIEPATDSPSDRLLAKVLTALAQKCDNLVEARFHLANAVVRGSAWGFLKGRIENVQIEGVPDSAWWVVGHVQNVDRRRLHFRPQKGPDGTPERIRLVWWSWKRRRWELVDPSWFACNVYDDTEANLGYGLGLRDALYFLMWFKEQLLADGLKAVKRWSRGIMTVGVDGLRASAGDNRKRVTDWEKATAESRERDALIYDKTDEFDIKFPSGEGARLVLEFVRYADEGIEELLVGSHLATSATGGGSYSLGKVHQQTTETLVSFDRELLDSGAMTRDFLGEPEAVQLREPEAPRHRARERPVHHGRGGRERPDEGHAGHRLGAREGHQAQEEGRPRPHRVPASRRPRTRCTRPRRARPAALGALRAATPWRTAARRRRPGGPARERPRHPVRTPRPRGPRAAGAGARRGHAGGGLHPVRRAAVRHPMGLTDARAYRTVWDESKHPRGQPGNAGQFGSGGGGAEPPAWNPEVLDDDALDAARTPALRRPPTARSRTRSRASSGTTWRTGASRGPASTGTRSPKRPSTERPS